MIEHITLEKADKIKFVETLYKSPFITEFDLGISSFSLATQSFLQAKKHLFESLIDMVVSSNLLQIFFLKLIKCRKSPNK